jgi:hypothetical protein
MQQVVNTSSLLLLAVDNRAHKGGTPVAIECPASDCLHVDHALQILLDPSSTEFVILDHDHEWASWCPNVCLLSQRENCMFAEFQQEFTSSSNLSIKTMQFCNCSLLDILYSTTHGFRGTPNSSANYGPVNPLKGFQTVMVSKNSWVLLYLLVILLHKLALPILNCAMCM